MALKALVEKIEDVEEQFRPLYEETENGWVFVGLDDKDFKSKIDEFRTTNIEKKKELEEVLKKFEGVDPEEYRAIKKRMEEESDNQLIEKGKIDELLNQRTERMRQEYTDKVAKLEERTKKAEEDSKLYRAKLNKITVNDAITSAVSEVGVAKRSAMADILNRAGSTWSITDKGELVAKNSAGDTLYGKDGKDPLTPKEWAMTLLAEASHLFEPNEGGQARGSNSAPVPGSRIISSQDEKAFGANLEAIAKGEIQVR